MRFLLVVSLLFSIPAFSQEDSVYDVVYVDVPAEFPGGDREMRQWITANAVYPRYDAESLCSTIQVQFIVEADGKITNCANRRSCTPAFDEWALTLVGKMPDWKPALKNGSPVRSIVSLQCRLCFSD